jgi:predicted dehydrogenase
MSCRTASAPKVAERFVIVGGGFGLYGYLPAVLGSFPSRVVLRQELKLIVNRRPELECYLDRIDWAESLDSALNGATGVVIAVPPSAQYELVQQVLKYSSVSRIVIEKPVAPNADLASRTIDAIRAAQRSFRIGYTFLDAEWAHRLRAFATSSDRSIRIEWAFCADHFSSSKLTWKRSHSAGGGALRFYGIHLIALVASMGYSEVSFSALDGAVRDEPENWLAEFVGNKLPSFTVAVRTKSDHPSFQVEVVELGEARTLHSSASPFPAFRSAQKEDTRVESLRHLLSTFSQSDSSFTALYESVNDLWQTVEDATTSRWMST